MAGGVTMDEVFGYGLGRKLGEPNAANRLLELRLRPLRFRHSSSVCFEYGLGRSLGQREAFLLRLESARRPRGGRMVVIGYHHLPDRTVG